MLKQYKAFLLIFSTVFVINFLKAQTPFVKHSVTRSFNYLSYPVPASNSFSKLNFYSLPGNFYSKNSGFFCRQEWKFQAKTALPLKLRLGSVAYCDWMEGKINAYKP